MDGAFHVQSALNPELVARVFHSLEILFDLPEESKRAFLRTGFGPGYTPEGIEGVRDFPKDIYRSFWDILPPDACQNLFPEEIEGYRRDIEELYRTVEELTLDRLHRNYPQLQEASIGGMHSMRVSHYRKRTPDWIDMPCHNDIGFYTAYVGGSSRGLEGKTGEEWHDVVNPLGDVVIGAGTALKLYDPTAIPLKHRVVSTGARRTSIAFFVEPRAEIVLPNGEIAEERLRRIVTRIRGIDKKPEIR